MNKFIAALTSAAVVLAASLGSGAANAAVSQANANAPLAAQTQGASVPQPSDATTTQPEHKLTRQDVRNQLIQAENDGTMARLSATVYFGS